MPARSPASSPKEAGVDLADTHDILGWCNRKISRPLEYAAVLADIVGQGLEFGDDGVEFVQVREDVLAARAAAPACAVGHVDRRALTLGR